MSVKLSNFDAENCNVLQEGCRDIKLSTINFAAVNGVRTRSLFLTTINTFLLIRRSRYHVPIEQY